jgi:hypothetical protein
MLPGDLHWSCAECVAGEYGRNTCAGRKFEQNQVSPIRIANPSRNGCESDPFYGPQWTVNF